MASELLDFVIALVRDPDAAARYAADPGRALADAQLSGVTSADVDNLLPMVSDSLSMAMPRLGSAAPEVDSVWTSGAATAALDAFMPHQTVSHDAAPTVVDVPVLADQRPPSTFDGFETAPDPAQAEDVGWENLDHPVDPSSDAPMRHDLHDVFNTGDTGFEIFD